MQEYFPIACALHEHYQFAVLNKQSLDLIWRDENGLRHIERIYPLDVYTKEKAEFLLVDIRGVGEVAIRLDFIDEARWVSNGKLLGG